MKVWYQPSNVLYRNGKEFTDIFYLTQPGAQTFDEEFLAEAARIYDLEGDRFRTFEMMMILVYKD